VPRKLEVLIGGGSLSQKRRVFMTKVLSGKCSETLLENEKAKWYGITERGAE
jgi:hypothetical protein